LPQVKDPPELDESLDLLLRWDTFDRSRFRTAALGSAGFHALLALALFAVPWPDASTIVLPAQRVDTKRATPLIAPRFELTQKDASQGPAAKEATLEALLPRRANAPSRPFVPPPSTRAAAPATPQFSEPIPEPPKLVAQGNPNVLAPQIELPPPPPPRENPKLAFETPGQNAGQPKGDVAGRARIETPKTSVDEAVRQAARQRPAGGVVVSDQMDLVTGAGAQLSPSPNQGRAGSRLELLSDPQGVDFKPYLIQVLAAVRRNWFAVIPESAKLGQRGRVVIQFAIGRAGSVPKLVISYPSGVDSLDRAAVAGISASNPFPPLPGEFKGNEIRLQLSFVYNMPVQP
jgi:TonB family protein